MISMMKSIDLAQLHFHLATRYCKSVFYTVLLQYVLEQRYKKEKHSQSLMAGKFAAL